MRPIIVLALLAFALPVSAAEPEVRTLEPGQVSPPASIASLAWMEGRWAGEGLGGKVEESYLAPSGGQIIGHFRLVKDGKPAFYEFVVIRETEGSLGYRVKHFDPDGRAWEDKERWVEFRLVAVEGSTHYFSGLTLERVGRDGMAAHVRMSDRTGRRWVESFRFRRVR